MLFLFVIWQCLYQFANVYLQLLIGLDDVAFSSAATFFAYGVTALFFRVLIARFAIAGVALSLCLTVLVQLARDARFGCVSGSAWASPHGSG